ncbi:MAG: hypothetical protein M3R27_13230, partial [Bacteroidota bacterium]|nr:hypothetical protein [Bacteroidota bacterium]
YITYENTDPSSPFGYSWKSPDRLWYLAQSLGSGPAVGSLSFYDGTAGKVRMVFDPNGFTGIGTPVPTTPLHVEGAVISNQAVGYFKNTSTTTTDGIGVKGESIGTATNFGIGVDGIGNYIGIRAAGTTGGYTGLLANANGATKAAVMNGAVDISGTLNITGGAVSEINRTQTGPANLVPICYGTLRGTDGLIFATTGNFSVAKVSTGTYNITISGESYQAYYYPTSLTVLGTGLGSQITHEDTGAGFLRVYTYNGSGTLTDKNFSFIVYKP